MSSPISRSESQPIPTKRVYINDPSELPSYYSSTPGGTLYSTTPGGTKIVYDKSFLMGLRNSPISRTPPSYGIPDAVMRNGKSTPHNRTQKNIRQIPKRNPSKGDDHEEQFQLEL